MLNLKFSIIFIFTCFYLQATQGLGQTVQSKLDSIQRELEEIRNAKFKHSVKVANQTLDDFGTYLDKMLEKQFSKGVEKNCDKIVRKLGLYRGPEIKDFKSLAKMVMQSQAAAYYDPATSTFYIVMQNLPANMLNSVFAHELYHGFQDQHHDLNEFILSQIEGGLNDDELLARQALVEGEATYLMTLWTFKKQFGSVPAPSFLDMAMKMQAKLDVKKILEMLKSGSVPFAQDSDMGKAISAMDDIPPFMIETMVGAYLKGMAFVFEIQKQGWEKVEELYKRPPVSSEQILHPKKWLSKENPYKVEWPSFEHKTFTDWNLLESNTIGEIQWRIIFNEHDLAETGLKAAEGWDGDAFAVLEHKQSGKLLLLIYTSWDSEADAKEFFEAYKLLLKVKYATVDENVKVYPIGKEVLIIEGGSEEDGADHLTFMKLIKKSKKS